MGDEKDAFYVVRKGDIFGVYKNFSDCEAQLGSSMMSPSVTVYKGYSLGKEAEQYLTAHGLKNSCFSISASEVKEGIFGNLMVCPFQQPSSPKVKGHDKDFQFPQNRYQNSLGGETLKSHGFSSSLPSHPLKRSRLDAPTESSQVSYTRHDVKPHPTPTGSMINQGKLIDFSGSHRMSSTCDSCVLEFDGASKGNPGPAGAGAVLRADDGSVVFRLREGVGLATNNVAEYRAVLLGLKYALSKGFKHICVRGDSKLVCMQVQGLWKCKNPNMAMLCKEAVALKEKFSSFKIEHVLREFNAEADDQANRAVATLRDGEVQADRVK